MDDEGTLVRIIFAAKWEILIVELSHFDWVCHKGADKRTQHRCIENLLFVASIV